MVVSMTDAVTTLDNSLYDVYNELSIVASSCLPFCWPSSKQSSSFAVITRFPCSHFDNEPD